MHSSKKDLFVDRYVIFNWKMNPTTLADADDIFDALKKSSARLRKTLAVVCPPALFIDHLAWDYKGKRIAFGIQDASIKQSGSWTGEISYSQARNIHVSFALINHSDRRKVGESIEDSKTKMKIALSEGMSVVLCIGEEKRDYQGTFLKSLQEELAFFLKGVSEEYFSRIIIAYEPLWAIGQSKSASSHDIHEMVLYMRKILPDIIGKNNASLLKIIYGGSVDDSNVADLLSIEQLSGFLVGRASLDPTQFDALLMSVEKATVPEKV